MGSIVETIFSLALRQILTRRRAIIVLLIAAFPIVIIVPTIVRGGDWSDSDRQNILYNLLFGTVLPLIGLSVSAPVFSDEIEDRTLTNLILSPISRWQISVPKVLAAAVVTAVPLIVTTTVTLLVILEEEAVASAPVAAFGMLFGSTVFASFFAFIGSITTRAVVFGITYVFGFETIVSTVIPGLKYVSISGMAISIVTELSDNLGAIAAYADTSYPPVIYSVIVGIGIVVVCNVATVLRLRQMDIR